MICTEDCWRWHIVDYHPEMADQEAQVIEAIEAPTFGIFRDAKFENRDVYYLLLSTRRIKYTKVVVEFDENDQGEVKTAFRTDSPKSGEKLIWPESSD